MSMSLWNVAGVFLSPKGITLKLYSPPDLMKAVFCLHARSIGSCQYPLLRSNVENIVAPEWNSRIYVMFGSGYIYIYIYILGL